MSPTTFAAAAATTTAAASVSVGKNLKVVGIILAIASGLLIGSSFVFKKKGLLRAQAGASAGEGVAYLKSPLWWTGMTMMICGELCNFAAYAFVEAIIVTPMGALSVVICAILSSIFLNEKLSLFGWLGCILCILGSTIIALNGPQEQSVGQITAFQKLFLAPGFLAYAGTLFAIALSIIFYFAPRYGKKNMLWYIMVCSMIGGISVSVTTGLGAAIVTTASGDNQFKHWFLYFLFVFVAATLITEVYYLNMALALYNTAMVTPTYYVVFTFFSMVTTIILFQGLSASVTQILTIVMGFFTICVGITILQMSKVDPTQLKLDRRSTLLLEASRHKTQDLDEEKVSAVEDPGMDALRGSFGAMGSIIRAKTARRMSMSSRSSMIRARTESARNAGDHGLMNTMSSQGDNTVHGMTRHQLYDTPMPQMGRMYSEHSLNGSDAELRSIHGGATIRTPTIKFDTQDVVHQWDPSKHDPSSATHEKRPGVGRSGESSYSASIVQSPPTIAEDSVRELAEVPTSLENLLEPPQTAPAAYGVVKAKDHYRPHARDPFERGPATMPSTDSMATSSEDDGPPLTPTRSRLAAVLPNRASARTPSPRRYPKSGDKDDDMEESMSLWHRANNSMSSEEGDIPPMTAPVQGTGGIRLVTRPTVGTDKF